MPQCAIRVDSLAKRYYIGHRVARQRTLRDAIARMITAPTRNLRRLRRRVASDHDGPDLVWALQNVSFQIDEGEVLGVVGKNGAGKSTLLKILSRITTPTAGYADVYGRMGSLLEVGTGFHPELTGRDNVYLNGSILGMGRRYIDRRFDEIVDFAGIDRFLDTPVKYYSSGMYLRLAFAVAAHLDTEILIVDEVLSVGDAEFQRKCLGRMGEVASEGRTILFVSHDLNAIQRMCPRSILLERGSLVIDGSTPEVLRRYLAPAVEAPGPGRWIDTARAHRTGSLEVYFQAIQYSSDNPELGYQAYPDGPLEITLALASEDRRTVGSLAIGLYDQRGTELVSADTISKGIVLNLEKGRTLLGVRITSLHLNPGTYRAALRLYDPLARRVLDRIDSAFDLEVADPQPRALGRRMEGAATCRFEIFEVDAEAGGSCPPPKISEACPRPM